MQPKVVPNDTMYGQEWHRLEPLTWRGSIGAISNNASDVSGVNWNAKLVPVWVHGQRGGQTSEIVDGMRWAAGIDVPGVPGIRTPPESRT